MSQTQKRLARKANKKRAKTQRAQLRLNKASRESVANAAEPSPANEAFASGLNTYRSFHQEQIKQSDQAKVNAVIQKAKEKYEKLAPNRFYLILHNRFVPLSFIKKLTYFGILYKDEDPNESYYYLFDMDEDEDNESHRVSYFYRIQQYPPYFYAIATNWPVLNTLNYDQKELLFEQEIGGEIITPSYYLLAFLNGDSRFREAYGKSMKAQITGLQKLEHLREKALESFLQKGKEQTGQNVGENVEAKLRSLLSNRPFAKNYANALHNFQSINTSLFEE